MLWVTQAVSLNLCGFCWSESSCWVKTHIYVSKFSRLCQKCQLFKICFSCKMVPYLSYRLTKRKTIFFFYYLLLWKCLYVKMLLMASFITLAPPHLHSYLYLHSLGQTFGLNNKGSWKVTVSFLSSQGRANYWSGGISHFSKFYLSSSSQHDTEILDVCRSAPSSGTRLIYISEMIP